MQSPPTPMSNARPERALAASPGHQRALSHHAHHQPIRAKHLRRSLHATASALMPHSGSALAHDFSPRPSSGAPDDVCGSTAASAILLRRAPPLMLQHCGWSPRLHHHSRSQHPSVANTPGRTRHAVSQRWRAPPLPAARRPPWRCAGPPTPTLARPPATARCRRARERPRPNCALQFLRALAIHSMRSSPPLCGTCRRPRGALPRPGQCCHLPRPAPRLHAVALRPGR
mmetsp:Transcript_137954/g.440608  ORF Transcript_137954/g.440608 Transcript_137954/m.440608 type:complete len:229 (-) Transcript_137954:958-1644(-)